VTFFTNARKDVEDGNWVGVFHVYIVKDASWLRNGILYDPGG